MNDVLTFEFKGVQYKTVPFRVGVAIDYYRNISVYSGGQSLYLLNTSGSDKALKFVKMKVFIDLMCPELKKHLLPKETGDIGIVDFMQFESVYDTTVQPWIQQWEDLMSGKKFE